MFREFMVSFVSRAGAIALAIFIAISIPISSSFTQSFTATEAKQLQPELKAKAASQATSLTEGVQKTVLSNGLTVLTKEVHTAPVVSVQVWYRVGSRNERPGITGLSHQLEHLMFKGTKDRPIQFGRLLSALGSNSNAFTSYDMTAYFGTVGSEKLEALLTLEADRMVNTIAGESQLKSERTVVLSELDGGSNNPGTRLYRVVMKKAFPNSSYGWPVIGDRKDVETFTVEDVQNYYQTHYRPENATLVVVGNFDTQEVIQTINATFGMITPPPMPKSQLGGEGAGELRSNASRPSSAFPLPNAVATASTPKPVTLREPGSVPFLQTVYPTLPPITHPDIPAIDVMDAVLTSGKSSRLYQALVQTGKASNVSGNASTMIDPGWYLFSATPAQGKPLTELDAALQAEVQKLQTAGITAEELKRVQTQLRASFILGNRDVSSQASQLGYSQTVGGDYRFSDRYLEAVAKVTPADVQRVARQYLDPSRRVLGFFEPTEITAQGGSATPTTASAQTSRLGEPVDPAEVQRYLPKSAFQQASVLQPVQPQKFRLPNGLTVLLLSDRSSPSFTLVGDIEAGTGFDTVAKAGLGTLTAQNLMNGTKTKDALAIAANLEKRGASLAFSANRYSVNVAASALSQDLPVVVEQLADVLQNATFPEKELELSRQRNLVALKSELDNPGSLARRKFQQKLFPKEHPFHAMTSEESFKAIKREDLVRFYQDHYRPDNTTLTLMGDFDPSAVKALLTKELGNWQKSGKTANLLFPIVEKPKSFLSERFILPGKTQAVTLMGHPGIERRDPRYYAALLLNQVLGGDTLASRLGTEIRDRQGLTYGIYSYFQAAQSAGPFVIQLQTSAKDNKKAIEKTVTLLKQVHEQGITQAELDAAKTSLINSFPVELADPDSIASAILSDQIYDFAIGDFYNFPSRVQAVTLAEVNNAARELLFPDNLLVITATPE